MVIFSDICVPRFSILVSVDRQKCSLVWYTSKHGVAQTYCGTVDAWFSFFFLCFRRSTHGTEFSYIA
jgi:hypothetical protein